MTTVRVAPGVWRRRLTLFDAMLRDWIAVVMLPEGEVLPVHTTRTVQ